MEIELLGWTLIQSVWCPGKERRFGHTETIRSTCTQSKAGVRTEQGGSHLQAKDRGLGETPTLPDFHLQNCGQINFGRVSPPSL